MSLERKFAVSHSEHQDIPLLYQLGDEQRDFKLEAPPDKIWKIFNERFSGQLRYDFVTGLNDDNKSALLKHAMANSNRMAQFVPYIGAIPFSQEMFRMQGLPVLEMVLSDNQIRDIYKIRTAVTIRIQDKDTRDLRAQNKADEYLASVDKKFEGKTEIPTTQKEAVEVAARAMEFAFIGYARSNIIIPSNIDMASIDGEVEKILTAIRQDAQQRNPIARLKQYPNIQTIMTNLANIAKRAQDEPVQLLRYWDIMTGVADKYEITALSLPTFDWENIAGIMQTTDRAAYPKFDYATPGFSATGMDTVVNQTIARIDDPEVSGKMKSYLAALNRKFPQKVAEIGVATLKRKDMVENKRLAHKYFAIFCEAIGIRGVKNADDLVTAIQQPQPRVMMFASLPRRNPKFVWLTVLEQNYIKEGTAVGWLTSSDQEFTADEPFPRICADLSTRSEPLLAEYFNLEQKPNEEPNLTFLEGRNMTAADFPAVYEYLVAVERRLIDRGLIPHDPDTIATIHKLIEKFTPLSASTDSIPLLIGLYHSLMLADESQKPDLAVLDEITNRHIENNLNSDVPYYVIMFARELRRFSDYHLDSAGITDLKDSFVAQIFEAVDMKRQQLANAQGEFEKLKAYLELNNINIILSGGRHVYGFDDKDDDFAAAYDVFLNKVRSDLRGMEQRLLGTTEPVRGGNAQIVRLVIKYWEDFSEEDRIMIVGAAVDPRGYLRTPFLEFIKDLSNLESVFGASEFFDTGRDSVHKGELFHNLLSLASARSGDRQYFSHIRLLVNDGLAIRGLQNYPNLINIDQLISSLSDGRYLAAPNDGSGLVHVVELIPGQEITWTWPLVYDPEKMTIVVRGEFLPEGADDPRLETSERIHRAINRAITRNPDVNEWIFEQRVYRAENLGGILARRVKAIPLPTKDDEKNKRLVELISPLKTVLDSDMPITQSSYPYVRLHLYTASSAEISRETDHVGISGEVFFTSDLSWEFYVNPQGIVFRKFKNNEDSDANGIINDEDLEILNISLLKIINDELTTGDFFRQYLSKSMDRLPSGAPHWGDNENRTPYATLEYKATLEELSKEFAFFDRIPHIWLHRGGGVFISDDPWGDDFRVVLADEAIHKQTTVEAIALELMDKLSLPGGPKVDKLFFGRPVDMTESSVEVSKYKGSLPPLFSGKTREQIREIARDIKNNPTKYTRFGLAIYQKSKGKPRLANIDLAHALNYEVVTFSVVTRVEGKIVPADVQILSTFLPPRLKTTKSQTQAASNSEDEYSAEQ